MATYGTVEVVDGGRTWSLADGEGRTSADGAFVGNHHGQAFRLSAEVDVAVMAALARARAEEPRLTTRMRAVTGDLRRDVPSAVLVGPDEHHQIKEPFALRRKVYEHLERPGEPTSTAVLGAIHDLVRYTVRVEATDYVAAFHRLVALLGAAGCTIVRTKNFWRSNEGRGRYKGINTVWCDTPTRRTFEVQLHTPESLADKEAVHASHEVDVFPGSSADERASAARDEGSVFSGIDDPPGVLDLPDGEGPVVR